MNIKYILILILGKNMYTLIMQNFLHNYLIIIHNK